MSYLRAALMAMDDSKTSLTNNEEEDDELMPGHFEGRKTKAFQVVEWK